MASSDAAAPHREATPVRIGLMADAEASRPLRQGLESHGLRVERLPALPAGLRSLSSCRAQVLLVDLSASDDAVFEALETLLDTAPVPVVLNESGRGDQGAVWLRRLADKLTSLAVPAPPAGDPVDAVRPDGGNVPVHALRPDRTPQGEKTVPTADEVPVNVPTRSDVWVLGASFGGPEAVRRFFAALPGCPDATFFLVQHIGDGFVDLLASQLNRTTKLRVVSAKEGMPLEAGTVYVAPVRERIRLDDGRLHMEPDSLDGNCRPRIDLLMQEVAQCFGARSGAIIFSGMGDDGTAGAQAIASAGGLVWAQDSGSASVSSMPDCAAATGVVGMRDTPEVLARTLAAYLDQRDAAV